MLKVAEDCIPGCEVDVEVVLQAGSMLEMPGSKMVTVRLGDREVWLQTRSKACWVAPLGTEICILC